MENNPDKKLKDKYINGVYDAKTICNLPTSEPKTFSSKLLTLRLGLVRKYAYGKTVADLCCGSGLHLFEYRSVFEKCIGVDFSMPFLEEANAKKKQLNAKNVSFMCASIREIPIEDNSIGTAYSFSALYTIPRLEEIFEEVNRVLEKGGYFIFDLGNKNSINDIVCNAYPENAKTFNIRISEMLDIIESTGFEIVEHRSFQFLPLWGDRPWWMKPILSPFIERIMRKEIKNKMIDEWVSNNFFLRNYSFRQVFVCRKK